MRIGFTESMATSKKGVKTGTLLGGLAAIVIFLAGVWAAGASKGKKEQ